MARAVSGRTVGVLVGQLFYLFVAPHTPSPWGHVELVQKMRGLGSGAGVRQGSAESHVGHVDQLTATIWELWAMQNVSGQR